MFRYLAQLALILLYATLGAALGSFVVALFALHNGPINVVWQFFGSMMGLSLGAVIGIIRAD